MAVAVVVVDGACIESTEGLRNFWLSFNVNVERLKRVERASEAQIAKFISFIVLFRHLVSRVSKHVQQQLNDAYE